MALSHIAVVGVVILRMSPRQVTVVATVWTFLFAVMSRIRVAGVTVGSLVLELVRRNGLATLLNHLILFSCVGVLKLGQNPLEPLVLANHCGTLKMRFSVISSVTTSQMPSDSQSAVQLCSCPQKWYSPSLRELWWKWSSEEQRLVQPLTTHRCGHLISFNFQAKIENNYLAFVCIMLNLVRNNARISASLKATWLTT